GKQGDRRAARRGKQGDRRAARRYGGVPMSRVLLIEDSPTQACWLAGVLQGAGFEVVTAPDAAQGFEYLSSERFDLVLSDLQLPGESGFDLCRRVKSDAHLARTPVLILTAAADPA